MSISTYVRSEWGFENLSDSELQTLRNELPKYKNEMTSDQIQLADALYKEGLLRHHKKLDERNDQILAETGLQIGDHVRTVAVNMLFGPGETIYGRVVLTRSVGGSVAVKIAKPWRHYGTLDHCVGRWEKYSPAEEIKKIVMKEGRSVVYK